MHFTQLLTTLMLAAASTATAAPDKRAANRCAVGQTYCGRFLKNQGSGPNQNLGWNNDQIISALDRTPPKGINLRSGAGIVNNSVFLCKSPNGGGGGWSGNNDNKNNRLDWIAVCRTIQDQSARRAMAAPLPVEAQPL
ncbi:uncharacterized protein MYCFIDRAFT_78973 [Pseudocercospora fijiensis CIRAD86]|uniref:Uncharacterized protein n=1 Tax=Pseudocercospora fijiensis (strain CIRAD86) TaxID=383855 RepID=M2YV05_PSEFD|nr:uncharacterized protein MYCFIDRAFT_78973 [Pseudocercospora fijiensis CIRAD86]EME81565.1 hypothetical protein MYCFIDRAFT_78973 [Pseudocercospora fijiensis CIRAD86]